MTREEAISYGERVITLSLNDETQAFCEKAIEALQQQEEYTTKMDEVRRAYDNISRAELCEDAISRQEVDEIKELMTDINGDTVYAVRMSDMRQLPPVTHSERVGRWVNDKCSACGKGTEDLISSPEWCRNEEPNFCPFCGIKLQGG